MAQTGYTPILIYSSSTAAAAPAAGSLTNSTLGSELAINITDGKLFYKDNANAIQVIGWKTVPTTAGGTGLTSYTAGDTLYYAAGTTLTKLSIGANKTIMTSTGSAPQWSTSLDTTQGGTGLTSYAAGDFIYYATGTTFTKVAIGTAYQALQVNAGGTAPSWQPSASSVLTAQGDLLYASAANTLARLAKNTTATRYLANTGTTNNPQWDQVNLANGVTGTLPVGNGGTGTATAFTAGSVVFAGASGVYSQNNANFFWDNTNARLGIITATPSEGLHVYTKNALVESTNKNSSSAYFLQKSPAFDSGSSTKYSFYTESGTSSPKTLALGFISDINGSQGAYINTLNTDIGLVIQNGSANGVRLATGGTSWSSYSDERLKTIIEPISDAKQKVKMLRTVIGRYNTDEPEKRRPFFIAQDMQKVLPEAVDDETNFLEIRYTDSMPLLAAAIKELIEDIEKINAKLGI